MSDVIADTTPRVRAWIKDVWSLGYSTELGTFRQSTGGTIDVFDGVMLKTSGGKYVLADGATTTGILVEPLYNVPTATDVECVVLVRGPAEVHRSLLDWETAGTDPDTDPDVTGMIAALKALNPPILVVASAAPSVTL